MPIFYSMKSQQPKRCLNAIYLMWHVFVPLSAGVFIYLFCRPGHSWFETWIGWAPAAPLFNLPDFIKGSLPDFLWCYAFLSFQSFCWRGWKEVPLFFKAFLYTSILSTELMQYTGFIRGTADILDLMAYVLAFIIHYKNQ